MVGIPNRNTGNKAWWGSLPFVAIISRYPAGKLKTWNDYAYPRTVAITEGASSLHCQNMIPAFQPFSSASPTHT